MDRLGYRDVIVSSRKDVAKGGVCLGEFNIVTVKSGRANELGYVRYAPLGRVSLWDAEMLSLINGRTLLDDLLKRPQSIG